MMSGVSRTLAAIAASVALGAATGAPLEAASLPLAIRAATSLEVVLERDDTGARLAVRLTESDGPPLILRPLEVELVADGTPPRRQTLLTDATGRGVIPVRGERVRYSVRFAGGEHHAPHEARGEVGLGPAPTRLLIASEDVDFGLRSDIVTVTIHLARATPALPAIAGAPLKVRVDDGPVQEARTGPDGRLQLMLSPRQWPARTAPAVPVEVTVRFEGDSGLGASEATRRFPRALLTRLNLRAGHEDAGRGRLRFSGRVTHELGPWGAAPVRVAVRGSSGRVRYDLPALTDGDGVWNVAVPLEALQASGERQLEVAAFVPAEPGLEAAESEVLRLEVPRQAGRSLDGVAALAIVLVAGAIGAHASRRWVAARLAALTARLRQPSGQRAAAAAQRSAARLRTDVLNLRFVDADTGQPAEVSARVAIIGDRGDVAEVVSVVGVSSLAVNSDGRTGVWRLTLDGAGYMPRTLTLPSPHDGRGDGLVVDVERVARRIRRLYEAHLRRAGVAADWGLKTPREAMREAARHAGGDSGSALSPPVHAVECAYFGPTPPGPDEVAQLEATDGPAHEACP